MKRFLIAGIMLALVLCVSAFGGCASTPNNAKTGIFAIQQQYNHALQIGAWYGSLETCGTPTADAIFCSKPDVVTKIKQAKDVAGPAIAAAQATVRNPAFDESTASKITLGAQAALQVLTVITVPLEELLGRAITSGKAQPLSMTALPTYHGAPAVAEVALLSILALLNSLLKFVPTGTALWNKYKTDRDLTQSIIDEDRVPTDEEWAQINAETASLEAEIDSNAAARGSA